MLLSDAYNGHTVICLVQRGLPVHVLSVYLIVGLHCYGVYVCGVISQMTDMPHRQSCLVLHCCSTYNPIAD